MADVADRTEGPTTLQWTIYVVKIVICIISMGFIFPHAGSESPGQAAADKAKK